jgi:FKBP-type peptidyl-prolyl cis-trans isomerase
MMFRFLTVIVFIAGFQLSGFAQSDTIFTTSGLKYIVLQEGKGRLAKKGDKAFVHYTGRFLNGRIFDTSAIEGKPIKVVLGERSVIKGWEEMLLKMKVGTEIVVVIPPEMGYGKRGLRDPEEDEVKYIIPPNTPLVFELEVVKLKD